MKFALSVDYHHGEPDYPWDIKLQEFREQAILVEEAGFTALWFAEHHFAHQDGWNSATPNPILAGADLVAHTTRLRIGQCGVSLPDWHPIRVAEDVAMLDQMSQGRVDFGVMRDLKSRWDVQFNVNAGRSDYERNYALFAESLDVIIKAWTQDSFSHEGRFYQFPVPGWKDTSPYRFHEPPWGGGDRAREAYTPDGELVALGVHPKPYQKPHPPIWQMADSTESHVFGAKRGLSVMCYFSPLRVIRDHWAAYKEAFNETQDHEIAFGQNLGVMKPVYVAETMEEAIKDTREGINLNFGRWGNDAEQRKHSINHGGEPTNEDLNMDWFDFLMKHDHLWIGSPEDVAEKMAKYTSELNCEYFGIWHSISLVDFDKTKRSLDLFGDKVMPLLEKYAQSKPAS